MKTILLCWLLTLSLSLGYDLTLRDGSTLRDIKLREKTDLGILVMHADGVAFLDYSKIQVPDLFTFGFEEAKYQTATKLAAAPTPQPAAQPVTPIPASSQRVDRLYRPSPTSESVITTTTPANSGVRSQCAATTKKGYRCSRMAQAGRSYCYQH